jgi:WD40 repeat protein
VSEGVIYLWNSDTGTEFAELHNDGRPVRFSHDERRLLISKESSAVNERIVWDLKSRAVIAALDAQDYDIRSGWFSSDDSTLWTSSSDGTVTAWAVPRCYDAIKVAKKIVPRDLTDSERTNYFLKQHSSSPLARTYANVRPWLKWAVPLSDEVCK